MDIELIIETITLLQILIPLCINSFYEILSGSLQFLAPIYIFESVTHYSISNLQKSHPNIDRSELLVATKDLGLYQITLGTLSVMTNYHLMLLVL